MGRIFEKRKYKMFARFAKMSKAFNRIRKEIEIAVKAGGPDVKGNPRLRISIQNAKSVNMPKDRVDAAIKRALSKDTSDYSEVMYEGYAAHGIAVIVDTATDNPNRTVANVRHLFNKYGGSLGNAGSISFMFERKGLFTLNHEVIKDIDEFELEMIDHGLDELTGDEEKLYLYCAFQDFGKMQKGLEEKGIEVSSTELQYIPVNTKELTEEQQAEVNELLEALEEDDDVQAVYHNMA